jgi:hypothetical protein
MQPTDRGTLMEQQAAHPELRLDLALPILAGDPQQLLSGEHRPGYLNLLYPQVSARS